MNWIQHYEKEKVFWRLEVIVFVRISPFSSKTFKLRNRYFLEMILSVLVYKEAILF